MNCLFSATNALNKWLAADLPRLAVYDGHGVGTNSLSSDKQLMSWQLHIIDNDSQGIDKTVIACEAHSRFVVFIPADESISMAELTEFVQLQWLLVFAETLAYNRLLANSDIAYLIDAISQHDFTVEWVKNTDLSINGHISDAGLWVTDTLRDRDEQRLSANLAIELAIHLNSQPKSAKQHNSTGKQRFVPIERLLTYCQQCFVTNISQSNDLDIAKPKHGKKSNNVIDFTAYKQRKNKQ